MTTVLLATYNGEKYLQAQIDSLRTNEGVDHVLLQDDGSTDGTVSLLADAVAADPRFALGNQMGQHVGAIGNFMSLIRQCPMGYTALCDQDDVWHEDRIAAGMAQMQQLEAQLGADTPLLVHSDMRVVDESGHLIHTSAFTHQGWDGGANTLAPLLVQNNVTGCTLLMNGALLKLIQSVPVDAISGMAMHDWFIALTAASFGEVHFLATPLVDYRQHGHNVKGSSKRGLWARGIHALGAWQRGKARIALTYVHARHFLNVWGDQLPASARRTIEGYLATESMGKLRRVWTVQHGGYRMQSRITRAGQILFG